jgi:hypothetical protein
MKRMFTVTACLLLMASPAVAQMVKSKVTASNGVQVDVAVDDFAGRAEYSAPVVEFTPATGGGSGIALVAKVRRSGALSPAGVQGFIMYSGEWQYYGTAVFKGGDPVSYTRLGGDVGSCRYRCTLTERYTIEVSAADIKKHAENGILPIQIRASKTGNTALLQIPTSYFDAVNEVAR